MSHKAKIYIAHITIALHNISIVEEYFLEIYAQKRRLHSLGIFATFISIINKSVLWYLTALTAIFPCTRSEIQVDSPKSYFNKAVCVSLFANWQCLKEYDTNFMLNYLFNDFVKKGEYYFSKSQRKGSNLENFCQR